jgi:hypothetical protein
MIPGCKWFCTTPITRAGKVCRQAIIWQFFRELETWRSRPVGSHVWTSTVMAHLLLAWQTSVGTRWRHVSSCGTEPFGNFFSLSKATYTVSAIGGTGWIRQFYVSPEDHCQSLNIIKAFHNPHLSLLVLHGVYSQRSSPPFCLWEAFGSE